MKQAVIHMWDVHEIVLHAKKTYDNPYTDVTVWCDLKGPGFDKRVYGFWDGEDVWKIRVTANAPGNWTYTTGANVMDDGLAGIYGGYLAIEWTEEEKKQNVCRRGIIRATENGHCMEYADGTPFFAVGDTWWGLATYRWPWYDDDEPRPTGKGMGMKDMARRRIEQGYNLVGCIVAYPTWAKDGKSFAVVMDDEQKTTIRKAWADCSVQEWFASMDDPDYAAKIQARDMHNDNGDRPFFFPGKIKGYEDMVPDYDRINPDYFKVFDKKVNWLNEHGVTVFMEALRRDSSHTWKNYYNWPMVYTRYIQYLFSRYQANNILFSPIHFDTKADSIDGREYNEPINLMMDIYGQPPFGTLFGTNAAPSTMINYGGPEEQHWKTFDQTGNWRDHQYHWLLTDIYNSEHPTPSINGEPYYSGHVSFLRDKDGFPCELLFGNPESMEDQMNSRSSYYGSALNGAFAGVMAGFEAGWSGNVEDTESPYKLWDIFDFPASKQLQYVRDFMFSEGKRYQELIPDDELASPNFQGPVSGWRGWISVCATRKRDLIMGYSEKDAPKLRIRGLRPYDTYEVSWFNPRTGEWAEEKETVMIDPQGFLITSDYPDKFDWAWKMKKLNDGYPIYPEYNGVNRADFKMTDLKFTFIETDSTK